MVLKKNHDKIAFVVVPFTSQERGLGLNKISLGTIDSLPDNLKAKETFAVINQIRTVNASRFYSLINNGEIIEAAVPGDKMSLLYSAIINDLLQDANSNDIKTVARNLPKK